MDKDGEVLRRQYLFQVLFVPWPIFTAAFPLPPLPKLTPKTVYPSMRPSFYLPLWDVLQYLNEVSTAWALEWGVVIEDIGEMVVSHRVEIPLRAFYWKANSLHFFPV